MRSTRRRRRAIVPVVATIALVVAGCAGDEGERPGTGGGVAATLDDFSIALDATGAPAGTVTFDVTNEGGQAHELVVVDTDLAEGELPIDDAGDVDEGAGSDLVLVGELEDLAPGATRSLTVTLPEGSYVLICNLPGHYEHGMHASFTVH